MKVFEACIKDLLAQIKKCVHFEPSQHGTTFIKSTFYGNVHINSLFPGSTSGLKHTFILSQPIEQVISKQRVAKATGSEQRSETIGTASSCEETKNLERKDPAVNEWYLGVAKMWWRECDRRVECAELDRMIEEENGNE